ncbi:MAG: chloride channel protein [Bacteroidales bacterium]|nr:chloride channel protein [Bacteroidales bacterium]
MARKILVLLSKIRRFIKRRFSNTAIVLILSFFTGILGGTAAIIIKNLLHFTVSSLNIAQATTEMKYIYLAFPLIGIILTSIFVTRFVRDDISHGVSIVLKALSRSDGKLRPHNMYSSMIASSITVGFGGSVGLEAPIVLTGSAIGSNLARSFNLSAQNTRLLLACGSAGAMAAIFKAPIAAIVFAIEVLMLDFTAASLLPLLISAATGTVLSLLFLGEDVMLSITNLDTFHLENIPFYIVLGILTGLTSIYFLRTSRLIERLFKKIKCRYVKAIIGGSLLGGLIFLFPVLYGEGYENINDLLNNPSMLLNGSPLAGLTEHHWIFITCIAAIILVKVIATSLTTSAGGNGGTFAPSLFVGAFVGFFLAEVVNVYTGMSVPYINFVLAGMAGVMTGVMHAPLTAIFLIAEISTGYTLLIPLMITAACSYITVNPFERHSIYSRQLAEKGTLRTHNKDKFALQKIDFMSLIDKNILTVPIHSTLREYTQYIAKSKRNIFVVLDKDDKFQGLLLMDEHRDMIFRQDLYDLVNVSDLMYIPDVVVYDTDTGEEIVEKFKKTRNFNLPVITKDRTYLGFLSKATVLGAYQSVIASESED